MTSHEQHTNKYIYLLLPPFCRSSAGVLNIAYAQQEAAASVSGAQGTLVSTSSSSRGTRGHRATRFAGHTPVPVGIKFKSFMNHEGSTSSAPRPTPSPLNLYSRRITSGSDSIGLLYTPEVDKFDPHRTLAGVTPAGAAAAAAGRRRRPTKTTTPDSGTSVRSSDTELSNMTPRSTTDNIENVVGSRVRTPRTAQAQVRRAKFHERKVSETSRVHC